jgi:hypothetical protein
MTEELRDFLVPYGFPAAQFNVLLQDEILRHYSQIAGVFNLKGQTSFIATTANPETGEMHRGVKGTVGPIDLGGMKTGFQFQAEIANNWWWNNRNVIIYTSDIERMMNAGGDPWDHFTEENDCDIFQQNFKQEIVYSGPRKGEAPILTVADDVSSWNVGDTILVTATNYDPNESETFTIVECDECAANQVKVDRAPTNTHWGRIDDETGADQRAEVALLTRNVRFYGEMDPANTCKYARTREQDNANSPNVDNNYCWYYTDVNGGEMDLHGAHSMITENFNNFHMTHIEIFNAGQPRVGRYPVHWHLADYVGERGGYEDPSYIDSLSIHDCFSRFATIHATHEVIITVVCQNKVPQN